MSTETPTGQRFTARDSRVIAEAERRRKTVLSSREDKPWLLDFSSNPRLLLSRMAKRGSLHALGAGRYAIAVPGRLTVEQTLPWTVVLDGVMSPYGNYYLGFFSALVDHHLTDVESPTIHVALNRRSGVDQPIHVTRRPVVVSYTANAEDWFGIETVRIARSERYRRSDIERTLVDCLARPRLCGSSEIWIRAWERALREDKVDVAKLCDYARRLGSNVARRTGFMLSVGDHGAAAEELLAEFVGGGGTRRLDVSLPKSPNQERDTTWGIGLNVPRDFIEGMFAYAK